MHHVRRAAGAALVLLTALLSGCVSQQHEQAAETLAADLREVPGVTAVSVETGANEGTGATTSVAVAVEADLTGNRLTDTLDRLRDLGAETEAPGVTGVRVALTGSTEPPTQDPYLKPPAGQVVVILSLEPDAPGAAAQAERVGFVQQYADPASSRGLLVEGSGALTLSDPAGPGFVAEVLADAARDPHTRDWRTWRLNEGRFPDGGRSLYVHALRPAVTLAWQRLDELEAALPEGVSLGYWDLAIGGTVNAEVTLLFDPPQPPPQLTAERWGRRLTPFVRDTVDALTPLGDADPDLSLVSCRLSADGMCSGDPFWGSTGARDRGWPEWDPLG